MIASNLAVFAWKPVDETKIKKLKENRENLLDSSRRETLCQRALILQSHVSFLKYVPLILVKLSPGYKDIGLWLSMIKNATGNFTYF